MAAHVLRAAPNGHVLKGRSHSHAAIVPGREHHAALGVQVRSFDAGTGGPQARQPSLAQKCLSSEYMCPLHAMLAAASIANSGPSMQVGPRYELEKFLGAGSFSRVCLAHDTVLGIKVPQSPQFVLHSHTPFSL